MWTALAVASVSLAFVACAAMLFNWLNKGGGNTDA